MSIKLVDGDTEVFFEEVPTLDDDGNPIIVDFVAMIEYKAEINDRENYDYLDWSIAHISLKWARNDDGVDLEVPMTDKMREKLEQIVWQATLKVEENCWAAINDSLW